MITVPYPNTDRSLLTIEQLRAAAGLATDDTSQDAMLTPLGGYISAAITTACKVARAGALPPTLRLETVVETFRLKSCQPSLVLARHPVVEIETLVTSGSTIDYELDAAAGILYSLSGDAHIHWGIGPVEITYSAGYEDVPDDLVYAAQRFVQGELAAVSRDPSLKRLKIEGISEREWWVPTNQTRDSIIPADVMDILVSGGYVNMVVK